MVILTENVPSSREIALDLLSNAYGLGGFNYSLDSTKNEKENRQNQGRNTPMSEASKRYYERHKRLGLCVRCNRMASYGKKTCRACLRKISERWKILHPLICHECKEPIKLEERNHKRLHKQCAEKRKARREPPVHRRAALAYQERHRKLGLCYKCPRKRFKGGLCRRHYGMVLERNYERAAGRTRCKADITAQIGALSTRADKPKRIEHGLFE